MLFLSAWTDWNNTMSYSTVYTSLQCVLMARGPSEGSRHPKESFREANIFLTREEMREERLQVVYSKHLRPRVLMRTMHRILPCSWRIQGCVSRGNPRITSETRPRIFHRTNPRISFSFQSPLPHECTWVGETQTVVARVDRERVYLT